jgi:hypothetical protein
VIFSYYLWTKSIGEKLEVCWKINEECNGHFLEVFQPVRGITFTDDSNNIDYQGSDWHKDFDPSKIFLYKDLYLNIKNQNKLYRNLNKLGKNYASIHIRRTDQINFHNYSEMESYEDFCKFIDEQKSFRKIFLATDNSDTQKWFLEKHKEIFVNTIIQPSINLRKTSLSDAAIDIFTCIKGKKFMGTSCSGYTNFINWYRKNKYKIY